MDSLEISTIPKNYWSNIENQRKYFSWLSNKLNIKSNEDWYNIKLEQLYSLFGSTLMKDYYYGSLFQALKSIYPEYEWIPWLFIRVPRKLLEK